MRVIGVDKDGKYSCNCTTYFYNKHCQHIIEEQQRARGEKDVTIFVRDNMDNNLTVKRERVLEAAKGCPDVAKALKTIFPEAFKDNGGIRLNLAPSDTYRVPLANGGFTRLECRTGGEQQGAIFLPEISGHEWRIVKDSYGHTVLQIFKKQA